MGMPVVIEVVDPEVINSDLHAVLNYFRDVDEQFSTYKETSEISQINDGKLSPGEYSLEMKKILSLCEHTKKETNGYFDIEHKGKIDPSGLVKGYAIWKGAQMLLKNGYKNFYIEIAGDIQTMGLNADHEPWRVGIENPFDRTQIIKVVKLSGEGIATSGTYIRGNHIYNPLTGEISQEVASVTVIAKNVYEADRFATAAFVMGRGALEFIEKKRELSALLVTQNKTTIKTSNFTQFELT